MSGVVLLNSLSWYLLEKQNGLLGAGIAFLSFSVYSGTFLVIPSLVHALYRGIKEGFEHGLCKLTGLVSH